MHRARDLCTTMWKLHPHRVGRSTKLKYTPAREAKAKMNDNTSSLPKKGKRDTGT